jgi:3'-phosphoadenosine 5'-phosphosulfate (PAPS) 3'-phosphatase
MSNITAREVVSGTTLTVVLGLVVCALTFTLLSAQPPEGEKKEKEKERRQEKRKRQRRAIGSHQTLNG